MIALFTNRRLRTVALLALLILVISTAFYAFPEGFQHLPFPSLSPGLLNPSSTSDDIDGAKSTALGPSPSHSRISTSNGPQTQPTSPPGAIVAAVKMDTDLGWLSEVNNRFRL